MKKCPNGHEVSDVAKFCPKCGAELHESIAEEVRFCKKCGNERKGAEKFCSHCGTPFYGDQTSLDLGEVAHGTSTNKTLIYILILVPIILIGGYFVNNHIQEKNRIEKEKIEENERAAEEERKRIEEENSPTKMLYKIAKNGSWGWRYMFSKSFSPGFNDSRKNLYTQFIFLYPISETTGKLSYLEFTEISFGDYCGYQKLTSVYTITDNLLRATLQSFNGYNGKFFKTGDNIVFRIEKAGDKVNLIELDSKNYTWSQMEPYTQKGVKIRDFNK